MKKLLFAVVLLASNVRAWEFPQNPDRFPSVGFNTSTTKLSGNKAEIDQLNPILTRNNGGPSSFDYLTVGGDVRLPASDSITLTLGYDWINSKSVFTRQQDVYQEKNKLDGYRYSLGLRFYLNK